MENTNIFLISLKLCIGGGYDWAYFPKCPFLYLQKIRVTNIINLQNCVDDIYSGFNPTCRNEINKAKKIQNVKINYAAEYDYCNNIVQQMFKQKGIDRVTQEKILCLDNDNLVCVLLTWNGVEITHTYLIDENHKTVLLHTSGSLFRFESAEVRKNYSYLNRFLHWQDILYFRDKGYHFYDFGGLGFLEQFNDDKSELNGIIKFKQSFGGKIQYIYKYEKLKITSHIIRKLKKLLKFAKNYILLQF